MTTPRMLSADELKKWAAEQLDYWESHDDVPNSAGIIAIKDLLVAIQSGRLDAPPAALNAEGLLPCPFCGDTPPKDSFYMNQGDKWGGVQCCIQGPEVRTKYDRSPNAPWHKDAIEAWNTRPAVQGWIPVSERLPEIGQVVQICWPSGYDGQPVVAYGGREAVDDDGWLWGLVEGGSYGVNLSGKNEAIEADDDYPVTHWMPLPPPPTREEV